MSKLSLSFTYSQSFDLNPLSEVNYIDFGHYSEKRGATGSAIGGMKPLQL